MRSDNMLLLHGNNRYHAKEHEYQGTDIVAENTYRAELGLHLYGKSWQETTTGAQLLNWKTITPNSVNTIMTIENNGYDITISANITEAGSGTSRKFFNIIAPLSDTFAGKTITWSCATWETNVPQENTKLGLMYKVDGKMYYHKTQTITIPENATDIYIRLFLVEGASTTVPVGTYTVKFTGVMLNYGDTVLPWEPYTGGMPSPNPDYPQQISSIGDSGSVDVMVTGKNLLKLINGQNTMRGVTVQINDGIITLTGVATETGYTAINIPPLTVQGRYTLSINTKGLTVVLVSADWKVVISSYKHSIELNNVITRLVFVVDKGVEYNITNIQVQLERGATVTPYQPYREPQTLTINTPNGLLGIPVDTGGNYTDSTGQQWICDEIDFERGVFVQRVKKDTIKTVDKLRETSDIQGRYALWDIFRVSYKNGYTKSISNFALFKILGQPLENTKWVFAVSEKSIVISPPKNTDYTVDTLKSYLTPLLPFEVCGVLATPIETPLTAEELAAYKAIKSYPHYTHIESAAELKVKLKEY